MSTRKPIVGLIFLVGLALITVGAGYFTFFLPPKAACPSSPQTYTVNVTIHQWYFEINGTDATHNGGWSICHGSTVTFIIRGMWEHDKDLNNASYMTHGFFISGVMTTAITISGSEVGTTPALTFNIPPGDIDLVCTVDCGALAPYGGHPIRTTIHVL